VLGHAELFCEPPEIGRQRALPDQLERQSAPALDETRKRAQQDVEAFDLDVEGDVDQSRRRTRGHLPRRMEDTDVDGIGDDPEARMHPVALDRAPKLPADRADKRSSGEGDPRATECRRRQ
jgi:hypothetical protein